MKYIVYKDTREQEGWEFTPSTNCEGMEIHTLRTGDYTIKGFEDVLTIERKASTGEFAKNIVDGRFERELIRMEKYKWPFMVLEFELNDIVNFPANSGIPKSKWDKLRIGNWFMLKRLTEYQIKYKTKILLAGKQGKVLAASIFKRVLEYVETENPSIEGTS